MTRYDRIMALVPAGVVAALARLGVGLAAHARAGGSPGSPCARSEAGTVREATLIALAFCLGAAALVWIRPRLGRSSWSVLAAIFVAIDVGLMGVTSQLTQTPPNDLLAGTTPIEKLMAAKLPPGGRIVNYDPQTYSSYPGSPQGVPDLNIIPGPAVGLRLRIDRQRQLRVDDPHPRTGRSRHRPTVVGDAGPARPARGRDRARVLPRAAAGHADARSTISPRSPRTSARTRSSPEGYGANFNDTAYPFDPGPAPGARGGPDGLLVLRGVARARDRHPRPAAPGRTRERLFASGRCSRTDRPAGAPRSRCPRVPTTVTGPPSGRRRHRPVGPGGGRVAPAAAGGDLGGRDTPTSSAGSLSSALVPGPWQLAGFSQGYAVFTLRKPAEPIVASTAQRPAAARAGALQHDEVRGHPAARPGAVDGDPFRGVGLGLECDGLGQRGQGPDHPGQ